MSFQAGVHVCFTLTPVPGGCTSPWVCASAQQMQSCKYTHICTAVICNRRAYTESQTLTRYSTNLSGVIVHHACAPHRATQAGALRVAAAQYLAVLFLGFSNCSTVQPVVVVERAVFYRERAAGMYAAVPFAIAQVRNCLFLECCCMVLYAAQ